MESYSAENDSYQVESSSTGAEKSMSPYSFRCHRWRMPLEKEKIQQGDWREVYGFDGDMCIPIRSEKRQGVVRTPTARVVVRPGVKRHSHITICSRSLTLRCPTRRRQAPRRVVDSEIYDNILCKSNLTDAQLIDQLEHCTSVLVAFQCSSCSSPYDWLNSLPRKSRCYTTPTPMPSCTLPMHLWYVSAQSM